MSSDEVNGLLGILVLLVLVLGIPLSLWKGGQWARAQPGKRPFAWGYFQSFAACAMFLLVPFAFSDRDGIFLAIYGAFAGTVGIFMYRRHRWAWIVGTLFSFSPVLYIINGFYLKNRWAEMRDEGSAKKRTQPTLLPAQDQFYVTLNNAAVGPLSWKQVLDMFKSRVIHADTPCAKAGDEEWRSFTSMKVTLAYAQNV